MPDKHKITIQDLYPDLSPEEQKKAEARRQQYLAIIKRVYERKHGAIESGYAPEGVE